VTAPSRLPAGWHLRPVSETFPEIRVPWKAIAAELREAIEHDMIPGEPVGSIAETARMYQVNPNTARKALRALAAEGLLESRPRRGYFVAATAAPCGAGSRGPR
jgi:DNA-binding GntR family transcriptional regulator